MESRAVKVAEQFSSLPVIVGMSSCVADFADGLAVHRRAVLTYEAV